MIQEPIAEPVIHDLEHEHLHEHRMPYTWFTIRTLLQTALSFGVYYLVFPNIFLAEMAQPWKIVLWAFLFGLPMSLFEYMYHRYLLHSAVLPFLGAMHDAHAEHHGLTAVKAAVRKKEPELMVPVKSEYSIECDEQEASMMFPWFALPAFHLSLVLVFGLIAKKIWPGEPIYAGLLISVTLYFAAYEIWHAILHLPFKQFWQPMMQRKFGRVVEYIYSFHLMHHWRPTANVAVVGLWGVALWDHVFRTHHRPKRLPVNGNQVNYYDAALPKPFFPINMIDKWQAGMYKGSRAVERSFLGIFRKK